MLILEMYPRRACPSLYQNRSATANPLFLPTPQCTVSRLPIYMHRTGFLTGTRGFGTIHSLRQPFTYGHGQSCSPYLLRLRNFTGRLRKCSWPIFSPFCDVCPRDCITCQVKLLASSGRKANGTPGPPIGVEGSLTSLDFELASQKP